MQQRKHGKERGLNHCHDLRYKHHAPAVPAVDKHAAQRGKNKSWNTSDKTDNTQPYCAHAFGFPRRQFVGEPADGNHLHPSADERQPLPQEKQSEIAV